jgi:hypothetical protein
MKVRSWRRSRLIEDASDPQDTDMNIVEFANLLGWCTLLNFALLSFSSIALLIAHKPISKLHARLFKLEQSEISIAYFNYLANYKILILMFNLVPYLALRIMSQ